jgi:hypothetical protein
VGISEITGLITGAGVAGAWVCAFLLNLIYPKSFVDALNLIIANKDKEIDELKEALRIERARSDAGVLAGSIVKDAISGLRRELL